MQRSAVDVGKLEGSLAAVQNQLQETQANLSSVKADLQQATNALTSKQTAHVGPNPLKFMHLPLVLVVVPLPYNDSNQQGLAVCKATNSST